MQLHLRVASERRRVLERRAPVNDVGIGGLESLRMRQAADVDLAARLLASIDEANLRCLRVGPEAEVRQRRAAPPDPALDRPAKLLAELVVRVLLRVPEEFA